MKILTTKLNGVFKIKLNAFKDHRGIYLETYNKNIYKKLKNKIKFVQDDISVSKKRVLRGIHGDRKTWKLISCLHGSFYLLVVNNIKKHKQFRKYQFFKLSEKKFDQILVPPGFGNAHYVTSKKAIFHYKQSTYYDIKSQFTINWNDKIFKFKWPIRITNPIISKRDK